MNKDDIPAFSISTQLTMLGRDPAEQFGFVNAPLYKGSTIIYKTLDDIEARRSRFSYGTAGSPTIAHLEDAWTQLTGAKGTVLSTSGLGAVALALFSTTKAGDHILIPDSVYRPTRNFCNQMLARYGVTTTYYDPMIGADIERLIGPNTTTLFLEAPGSQSFEVQDIPALVEVARRHGVKTILDNTWATPIFFRGHDHGIDLTVEAGTKYLGGHSDILLGLVTANEACWPALRATYDAMSMLPGAEDCVQALRGMRTLFLRLKEAERRGLEMARWLSERPEVSRVLHPAFESCPGHAHWKRDFKGSSGLFSIVLAPGYTRDGLAAMLDNLSIFSMGFSWGGYESLVIPFDCSTYRTATRWEAEGFALRLQIGLEDMDDLKGDLARGFARLAAAG
ncbi:cystathionine beta-lyase [Pseudomonas solani]|uniref:Cystathionine beta-lyase n=1 Tax=Pseudomonas solani TaxID=2731552 RepID=A0AAU7YB61_9PSED|nr:MULTISPECIES: cystathionine beta-lyase [Pseudomonas]MBB4820484.1 cystathionine beta-lyase [Pseudomonas alcaligenes]WCD77723.1 cystathionine beta-lyase [Pseudomonas sp. TUM22785]BCD88981.1 cystathionine beta-lyase [Pseudomonas solani]